MFLNSFSVHVIKTDFVTAQQEKLCSYVYFMELCVCLCNVCTCVCVCVSLCVLFPQHCNDSYVFIFQGPLTT